MPRARMGGIRVVVVVALALVLGASRAGAASVTTVDDFESIEGWTATA